jgi:hypothetical protein
LILVPRHDYVALGEQGIRDLLAEEHAVVWTEVEAKLADRCLPSLPSSVDPHHLTTARHNLTAAGFMEQIDAPTRGGRDVPVIVPVEQRLRKRAIADAAARKRLLQTRFLTWASGSPATGAGVIGPAGETHAHLALAAAAKYGYRLLNPDTGHTEKVLGVDLRQIGSVDNAAVLTKLDKMQMPVGFYTTVIEVKNIRSWIYRTTAELYQLLFKAAYLQMQQPTARILPVLICRRSQYMTHQLAEALGFYVIATKRQYVPASLAETREFTEVTTELGYDLEPLPEAATPALVKHFSSNLQKVADRTADRWSVSAQALIDHFKLLRNPRLPHDERNRIYYDMIDIAASIHDGHSDHRGFGRGFDEPPF